MKIWLRRRMAEWIFMTFDPCVYLGTVLCSLACDVSSIDLACLPSGKIQASVARGVLPAKYSS
uniref:Uncharacterized protein n=1 Tax=Thermogemmatispora argillosa TaxID=2045280 RepID=A0A455T7L5_9CHLR|nr:hypothetical protein KTA_36380 [Thermogemmatispora argillosa]